jgi:hypothetical protein
VYDPASGGGLAQPVDGIRGEVELVGCHEVDRLHTNAGHAVPAAGDRKIVLRPERGAENGSLLLGREERHGAPRRLPPQLQDRGVDSTCLDDVQDPRNDPEARSTPERRIDRHPCGAQGTGEARNNPVGPARRARRPLGRGRTRLHGCVRLGDVTGAHDESAQGGQCVPLAVEHEGECVVGRPARRAHCLEELLARTRTTHPGHDRLEVSGALWRDLLLVQ